MMSGTASDAETAGTNFFMGSSHSERPTVGSSQTERAVVFDGCAMARHDLALERELGTPVHHVVHRPDGRPLLGKIKTAWSGILADAAAGSDYVKVRNGARFSERDIDILEVHEGWVHVATSLNGQAQPVAKWLAKGPPRTTAVQEGLAALLEMFTFRTYPRRARRLNDRVLAVDKAEDGASFLDVFEWFRTEGYEEEECFNNTRRVFRGGVLSGGAPFTKDACYCKGIVLNYAFIRSCVQHGRVDLLPYLFVGKVAHEDVPVLARRVSDGVVRPPRYLPPMFRDLNGLAIWMAYSTFFCQLGGDAIADHYARVFARAS